VNETTNPQSPLNHRASAAIAAAAEHLRPRLARAIDGAARATAQAAAPVITDAVRAAAPPLEAATRRLAQTVGEALAEADERSPARRQQRALEALRASGEAARRDLLERPGPFAPRTCTRCASTGACGHL